MTERRLLLAGAAGCIIIAVMVAVGSLTFPEPLTWWQR